MILDPDNWSTLRLLFTGWLTLFALIFGLGAWGAVAHISGAVVSAGALEIEGNRQVVQHPSGGVIAAIRARDGDLVQRGDVLLVLDGGAQRSQLGIVEGQWFEFLARMSRLAAERDGLDRITFDPELVRRGDRSAIARLMASQEQQFVAGRKTRQEEDAQLREQQTQISNENEGLLALKAATNAQSDLVTREITGQQTLLNQGLTQITRVLTPQRELARLRGIEGQVAANIAENRGKIAEIAIRRVQVGSKARDAAIAALRDVEFREIELREQRTALLEEISRLQLRAPVSGIVYGSTADTLRAVVKPAEPIMYVVPQDAALIVRAQIDPTHVDQVVPGQRATLRFTSFDARTTPELVGRVATLSADAYEDPKYGRRYYKADIRIDPEERTKLGSIVLLPGMPVESFVQTGDRSALSYFVKPMSDYFNRAFREG